MGSFGGARTRKPHNNAHERISHAVIKMMWTLVEPLIAQNLCLSKKFLN